MSTYNLKSHCLKTNMKLSFFSILFVFLFSTNQSVPTVMENNGDTQFADCNLKLLHKHFSEDLPKIVNSKAF